MKAKILKLMVFFVAWGGLFWIIDGNFIAIAFLLAALFVYSVGKDSLLVLANEFDKNHNSLADNVRDLYEQIEFLKEDKEFLENQISDLRDQIDELKPRENKGFDPLYDFIDETESDKKAP